MRTRLIATLGITIALLAAMSLSAAPGYAALVAHWEMDEMSGPVIDSVGGYNGTGTYTPTQGQIDGALSFNGSDYVTVTVPSVFSTFPNGFSVSLWAKTASATGAPIAYWGNPAAGAGFGLYLNSNWWLMGNNSAWELATAGILANSKWHLYTMVWDKTNMTTYIDGVQADQQPTPNGYINDWTTTMSFGADNRFLPTLNLPFTGSLDDVRIYDSALSAGEIGNLYEAGAGGVPEPATVVGMGVALIVIGYRRLKKKVVEISGN